MLHQIPKKVQLFISEGSNLASWKVLGVEAHVVVKLAISRTDQSRLSLWLLGIGTRFSTLFPAIITFKFFSIFICFVEQMYCLARLTNKDLFIHCSVKSLDIKQNYIYIYFS